MQGVIIFNHPKTQTGQTESLAWDSVETSIPARFERCVEVYRERPAVTAGNTSWSYDELNRAANRVARTLIAQRGQAAEPIALLFEQGAHFLAGLLGVMKAGKFYVPLDPLFPKNRNDYILKDSGATLLLTDTQYLPLAEEFSGERMRLLDIESCGSAEEDNPGLPVPPDALGLLIHTSGSGCPKGCCTTSAP
jgi:non-ribosomal peptide synthetase component F